MFKSTVYFCVVEKGKTGKISDFVLSANDLDCMFIYFRVHEGAEGACAERRSDVSRELDIIRVYREISVDARGNRRRGRGYFPTDPLGLVNLFEERFQSLNQVGKVGEGVVHRVGAGHVHPCGAQLVHGEQASSQGEELQVA